VKERFFREAETAGRFESPEHRDHLRRGREHDLCYIAMELLKGQDLVRSPNRQHTLDDKVVSIVARVADALGYATGRTWCTGT